MNHSQLPPEWRFLQTLTPQQLDNILYSKTFREIYIAICMHIPPQRLLNFMIHNFALAGDNPTVRVVESNHAARYKQGKYTSCFHTTPNVH